MKIDPSAGAAFTTATSTRTQKKHTKGRPDLNFVRQTLLIPRTTNKAVKDIAEAEETTIQCLLEEAVQDLLVKRGANIPFFPEDWKGWELGKAQKNKRERGRVAETEKETTQ